MERTLRFIGGTQEILHTPLKDGTVVMDRDVDFVVKDNYDYSRLTRSGRYIDVTPESKPAETASVASVPDPAPPVSTPEVPSKPAEVSVVDSTPKQEVFN